MSKSGSLVPTTHVESVVPKSNPERTPGDTSKSKKSLGIPSDRIITWVPFDLSLEDNSLLKAIGKARNIPCQKVPVPVLKKWFEESRESLEAEAGEFLSAEKSEDDIKKELDRVRAKMSKLEAFLATHAKKS